MTATERVLAHFDRISEAPDAFQRLRRLVLDLAVRGKLVPQDPSDGSPAKCLATARAALTTRAVETSRQRWTPSDAVASDDAPDDVPPGWVPARINDTGLYVNGLAFKPSDWKPTGIPIVRIQNLTDPTKEFNYAEGEFPDEVIVRDGDILVSWSATLQAFEWTRSRGVLNQHIFRVLPTDELTTKRFLYLLLRHAIRAMADSRHAHGLVMSHINRGPFLAHVVLIPPMAEQHRIVAKVDELMALCDRLEATQKERESRRDRLVSASLARLRAAESSPSFGKYTHFALRELPALTARVDLVREFRQALLDLAFQGKLTARWRDDQESSEAASERFLAILSTRRQSIAGRRPAKPLSIASEHLPPIPGSWTWSSCDAICSQITDGEHIQPPYQPSGVPMLTAKHVRDGYVTLDGCQMISEADFAKCAMRCKPEKGDILIVSVGATTGRAAIVTQSDPFALVRSVLLLKPLVSAQFLLRWLQSPWCLDWMRHASEASAQPHLYIGDTKRMPVPIPSAAEQDQIVAKVDELTAVCDHLERQLEAGRAARGALLEATLRDVLRGPELAPMIAAG